MLNDNLDTVLQGKDWPILTNFTEDLTKDMNADELFEEGNRWRKAGNLQRAMEYYLRATALVPDHPAATALELIKNIYAFRNTDMINP